VVHGVGYEEREERDRGGVLLMVVVTAAGAMSAGDGEVGGGLLRVALVRVLVAAFQQGQDDR
jgi:hypothetical protein